MPYKTLLLILDGFGINKETKGNAIKEANPRYINDLFKTYPTSQLSASGLDVGLPEGNMGNSEVGHLNIGAGRIVYQLNTLIDKEIKDGDFFVNEKLLKAIDHAKRNKSNFHLFGLLSDGNVHSNIQHLWAILELCKKEKLKQVYYHAFMDGRDTLPNDGIRFMEQFLQKSKEVGIGEIATISGRYYAMDRDKRWERIQKAYDAIVHGHGNSFEDPIQAIQKSYNEKITDEFIIPAVHYREGKPVGLIKDNDSIVFFNFRADRARQITSSFILPTFDEFESNKFTNLKFTVFNEYDINFKDYYNVAFRLPELTNILGGIVSKKGFKQLRLAETEKYAHVTFFFNGGVEKPFEGEYRILVPSPKVATYDLQPEMSAEKVKEELINAIQNENYEMIITNFANCDMVGHTGIFNATVKAVKKVDQSLEEIIPEALKKGYAVIVTADHGNADKMLDENGNIFTAHSKNPVPICLITPGNDIDKINSGRLADIAPTMLKLMNIDIPDEMNGKPLF